MAGSIDRWRRILNEVAGEEIWSPDDPEIPGMYFQAFRPDGLRLDEVFRGVHRGDEILPRLQRVFAVAGNAWTRPGLEDWYFIVRNPSPASPARVMELAAAHLKALSDLVPLPRVRIDVEEGAAPKRDPGKFGDLEATILDGSGDFVRDLEPEKSDALLLKEPLYLLACDYGLARYVLWPLYRKASGLEDPFAPHFELWTLGAEVRYVDPDVCRVWVPRFA
jgi:hypothetical protein